MRWVTDARARRSWLVEMSNEPMCSWWVEMSPTSLACPRDVGNGQAGGCRQRWFLPRIDFWPDAIPGPHRPPGLASPSPAPERLGAVTTTSTHGFVSATRSWSTGYERSSGRRKQACSQRQA